MLSILWDSVSEDIAIWLCIIIFFLLKERNSDPARLWQRCFHLQSWVLEKSSSYHLTTATLALELWHWSRAENSINTVWLTQVQLNSIRLNLMLALHSEYRSNAKCFASFCIIVYLPTLPSQFRVIILMALLCASLTGWQHLIESTCAEAHLLAQIKHDRLLLYLLPILFIALTLYVNFYPCSILYILATVTVTTVTTTVMQDTPTVKIVIAINVLYNTLLLNTLAWGS